MLTEGNEREERGAVCAGKLAPHSGAFLVTQHLQNTFTEIFASLG